MARRPLHLVNNHPHLGLDGTQFVSENPQTAWQTLGGILAQQIDQVGIGKHGMQPHAFAGLARAHAKETLLRQLE
jgi:hypothetical protein